MSPGPSAGQRGGLLHHPASGGRSQGTKAGWVSLAPCLCLRTAVGSHGDIAGGFLCPAWTEDRTIADRAASAIVPATLESPKLFVGKANEAALRVKGA